MSTPSSPRRRPSVPPLADLDAPRRRVVRDPGGIRRPGGPTGPGEPGRPPNAGGPGGSAGTGGAAGSGHPAGAGADSQPGAATGPDGPLWAPRTSEEADEAAAQQAVAEERAALARAVLAERAERTAADAGGSTPPAARRWTAAGRPAAAPATAAVAALLVGLRLWLVGSGALYGTGPVRALDAVVAASVLLALALSWERPDRAGNARRLGVLLAVPVLVAGGLALLVPATPASAPAEGCPAAPVRGASYVGVTTAAVVARSGPGRSHEVSGRFPAGCAVGFAGYCLGDPAPAAAWPGWTDSRWLMVGRQDAGPAALLARRLSGEPEAPRFLPSALVQPARAADALPLLSTAECGRDALRVPGDTTLDDVTPGPVQANLAARAARAANIGFAVWVAPDPATGSAPLLRGGPYQQVVGRAENGTDSPGATGPSGRRVVTWDYVSLIHDLDLGRRTPTATVAVLAVACEAPSAPAEPETAAVTTYAVTGMRMSAPQQRMTGRDVAAATDGPLRGLNLRRLTTTACQTPR